MKKLVNKSVVIIILLFAVFQLHAQHRISGKVLQDNEEATPLEFGNIVLSTIDSVYITGINCDMDGHFELKNIPAGDYCITASYVGFMPQKIILNGFSKSVELGNIYMEEKTNELGAVTITASNTTAKTDRLVVFVTDQQKANSSNGINLLTTMQLPRLTVNPVTNIISLPGEGKIQLCINGANAQDSDVKALQPNDIIRVEYIDNPGLRYGNVDLVINYVLKRVVSGGNVSIDIGNSVTTGFSDDQLSAKINYKKSEFGFNYSLRYRKPSKIWADEKRTFNFTDHTSLNRFSDGLSADFKEKYHNFAFTYNLLDEKYYFNATVRYSILDDDKMRHSSQYISQVPNEITNVNQGSITRQHLPAVDLYYSRSLSNKQTLIFNVVGTYIGSEINQRYEEIKGDKHIVDIISDIDGKKYSIIGEGIYEKTFENNNRFTTGFKHTQSFADNKYTGTENSLTKMDQSDSYIYIEYSGKKDKFSYIGGAGLSRSWAKQKGENDYSYYTFRPKVTLQYDLSQNMYLRLKGEIYNTTPSLSNLSAVEQYIDTLQIIRGNPSLKPNLNYYTDLQLNWKKGIYGINLYSSYTYSPKVIMEDIIRDGNKFIQTYNNQKNWQKLNSELTFSGGPIKNILMFSLTGGINHYTSNGNAYSHKYTNLYYRAQIVAMYKKLMGVFQVNSAYDNFFGETMQGGENMHLFMLSYNMGNVKLSAGVINPFSDNYKRHSENRNKYRPYENDSFANDFSKMILIKFAWNFNFGRKAESGNKRINHSDTDSGILKTN